MEDLSAVMSQNWCYQQKLRVDLGRGARSSATAQISPTSQPITLISPKIWFSFKSFCLQRGRGERGKEAGEMGEA